MIIRLIFIVFLLPAISVAGMDSYAISNVNVIPMDRERVLKNRTVVVRNGVITAIQKGPPKGIKIINGRGKYLIPGLIDMHTHLFSDYEFPDKYAEDELVIMVANGVTTTRLMIGVPEHIELRKLSEERKILAPRIFAASPQFSGRAFGEIFNGYEVKTPEAARDAVRKAKQSGYDFIKLTFFLSLPVYNAIIDEARKQEIPVIGHVNRSFGIERAFRAKQQIEHLDGFFEALIPEGSKHTGSTSGVWVWRPEAWASIPDLDEAKIPQVAERAVAANPYSVPTLTFLKLAFGTGQSDELIKKRPDYGFLPDKIRAEMSRPKDMYWSRPPAKSLRIKYVDLRNKITKAIHDAGGKVMAGSDAPEWFLLYGFTLHRELESLSEAGLPNYAVLEAATKHPAAFFGDSDKYGMIKKGMVADLLLLNANPLEDISNTQKIEGVMLRGRWLPKNELDAMLRVIKPRFRAAFESR